MLRGGSGCGDLRGRTMWRRHLEDVLTKSIHRPLPWEWRPLHCPGKERNLPKVATSCDRLEFEGGNSLTCQRHQESESMERQKYALSQDECASPDMRIPSPQPIDKSKVTQPAPVKKKAISVEEYHARGQCRWAEEECKAAELKQKEREETLCKQEEIRWMDQEDLELIAREAKEREDKARCTTEEELIWHTLQEEEAARAAESPSRDENDEALDYYDNLNQDSEMASHSQGMILMSSQETAPTSSQDMAPISSQESKATAPASSQESATQEDTNMPSLETATGTTILDATDGTNMEDESCLEGPTLKCSLQEERVLLNPLLAESLDHLEDVSPGYLTLIEARIHEIRRIRASQTPVALPRALPGLPPLLPKPMLTEPTATSTLSEAIYSAASNLGTSVPHQTPRMPTHLQDQAETDQAVRVLEGINKAPGTMPDHSEPRTVPWWQGRKTKEMKTIPIQYSSHCKFSIQVAASSAFKFNASSIFREVVALSVIDSHTSNFWIVPYIRIFHVHLSSPFDFSNSAVTVCIWLCILVFYRSVV